MGQHATILRHSTSTETPFPKKECVQELDSNQISTESALYHGIDKSNIFDKKAIAQYVDENILGREMDIPNEGMGAVLKLLGICILENCSPYMEKEALIAIIVVLIRLRDGRKLAVQIQVTSTDIDIRHSKEGKGADQRHINV